VFEMMFLQWNHSQQHPGQARIGKYGGKMEILNIYIKALIKPLHENLWHHDAQYICRCLSVLFFQPNCTNNRIILPVPLAPLAVYIAGISRFWPFSTMVLSIPLKKMCGCTI